MQTRAEVISALIRLVKLTATKAGDGDFLELWLINDLIDDKDHQRALASTKAKYPNEYRSVLQFNPSNFDRVNEPAGVYGEKHIKVMFVSIDIYLNTDAVYRIAAPAYCLDELNENVKGGQWHLSECGKFALFDISDKTLHTKYFKTNH